MQAKELLEYQRLFLNWLDQYHRTYLENGDVLHKLQHLKDKLTEYNMRGSTKPRLTQVAQDIYVRGEVL